MTTKKPDPEYDESIVQKLDYVPTSHADPRDPHRWSGGFFEGGRRNSFPWRENSDPFEHPSTGGIGALAAMSADDPRARKCRGCHRVLRLSDFSPKPGRTYLLRSRCDRCVERNKAERKKDK